MRRQAIIILTVIFSLLACNQKEEKELTIPSDLRDGWTVSKPDKEGFDQPALKKTINNIATVNPKLDGIVIARHGKLIIDQYFNGYAPAKLHKIWSITKAISGTLLGILSDKGLLSVQDSIYKYLKHYITDTLVSARNITIEHLITMTSGLEWVELGGPKSAGFQLAYSNNWIEFTLSQPEVNPAGEIFNYSTGNTILLAPIIKDVTNKQASAFAKTHLFNPLGITHFEWDTQSEFWTKTQGGELPGAKRPTAIEYHQPYASLTNTGSGLRMRPRDLCKFGQLYLNNGKWNDQQIVSKSWIKASTHPHYGNTEYGYHWRLMTFDDEPCHYATGFGLQRIFVFPKLDLVVVMVQHHYETMPEGEKLTNQLLEDILKAIKE